MNTERCGCLKPQAIFASVLLALIVHSMLSLFLAAMLFWSRSKPTSGPVQWKWKQLRESPFPIAHGSSCTDGRTGQIYRW